MANIKKYNDEEIVGQVLDSRNYGKFTVLEKVDKLHYKCQFQNTNYTSVFNKYQVLKGSIRVKKVPFVQKG